MPKCRHSNNISTESFDKKLSIYFNLIHFIFSIVHNSSSKHSCQLSLSLSPVTSKNFKILIQCYSIYKPSILFSEDKLFSKLHCLILIIEPPLFSDMLFVSSEWIYFWTYFFCHYRYYCYSTYYIPWNIIEIIYFLCFLPSNDSKIIEAVESVWIQRYIYYNVKKVLNNVFTMFF